MEIFFFFFKERKAENSDNSRSSCVAPEARAGLASGRSEPCDTSFSLQGATSYPSLAAVWPSWVPTCWWHSDPTVTRRWQAITSSGTSWAGLFSCTWYETFRSFHLRWWVWGWSPRNQKPEFPARRGSQASCRISQHWTPCSREYVVPGQVFSFSPLCPE